METIPSSGAERIHPLMIVSVVAIVLLALVPFLKNFKYNDNHLNWSNHDYGKNLMMCSEQDSVFMTEGGDNQVFSTLYFMYAEKLRPDISPYDQKGNIFKRIYGDMRYIDPQTLDRRMNLVDTHLFMGEEPFYIDIRDRADPYFIPYWQGRRPVYLTWQRPNPGSLGDYYYKRYGIMFKVQDIEYALVDYLELKREIPVSEAQSQLAAWLGHPVSQQYTLDKIAKMQRAGYLQLAGGGVRFVRMYPPPQKGEYLDKLLLRWQNIPNAKYWDFLTREIFINYDYQMGEIYREKIGELQVIRSRERRPDIIREIDKRIQENWKLAKERYTDAIENGSDSLSILHNLAVVYLRNGIEDMDAAAGSLLRKAVTYYRNSWSTYSLLFTYLIGDILKHNDREAKNVAEMEKWMTQLKKELQHYRSARGNYQNHPVWKNFAGIENYIGLFRQVSVSQLTAMEQELTKQVRTAPAQINSANAQQVISLLYNLGLPFQYQPYIDRANALFDETVRIKSRDAAYIGWAFQIALQLQKMDKAYRLGKQYEQLNTVIADPSFYYTMGMVAFNMTNRTDARRYLRKFLDTVGDNRQLLLQLREPVENSKRVLESLK